MICMNVYVPPLPAESGVRRLLKVEAKRNDVCFSQQLMSSFFFRIILNNVAVIVASEITRKSSHSAHPRLWISIPRDLY